MFPYFSPNGDGRFDVARVSLQGQEDRRRQRLGPRQQTATRSASCIGSRRVLLERARAPEVGRAHRRRRARARRALPLPHHPAARGAQRRARDLGAPRHDAAAPARHLDRPEPRVRARAHAQRRRRRRAPRRARAASPSSGCSRRARGRRAWCSKTTRCATARRCGRWDGKTPSGRPVSPGTYLVSIETRDQAGNRGLSPPLNRRGLPATSYGAKLPGHGGITVRYLGVRPPNVATPAGDPVEFFVDARRKPWTWSVRRVGSGAATPSRRKTSARVRLHAPGASRASTSCRCARRRTPPRCPSRSRAPSATASSSSCRS